jgi:hypothetical protein
MCVDTTITSFTATPATIDVGGSSTLAWNVTNGVSCALTDGSGPLSTLCTGSLPVSPTANTIYTLTANGEDGVVTTLTASVTFNAPTIQTFTAGATGACATPATDILTWTSTDGTSATLSDTTQSETVTGEPVNGNDNGGSFPAAVCGDTFTLVVTGPGGQAMQTVQFN